MIEGRVVGFHHTISASVRVGDKTFFPKYSTRRFPQKKFKTAQSEPDTSSLKNKFVFELKFEFELIIPVDVHTFIIKDRQGSHLITTGK